MKYKLHELIDIPRVQRLLDHFSAATGMVTALLDLEGNILSQSGWQTICTDFHRVDPEMRKRCGESDTVVAGNIKAGEKYTVYQCRNGLMDAATPVMVQGEHVGNFFTGQFLFENPDVLIFREQARQFGLDEEAYLEALKKVPIIDKAKLPPFLEYFADFAELLGDMGLKQLQQMEANTTLELRVAERTQELQQQKELLQTIIDTIPVMVGFFDTEKKTLLVNREVERVLGWSSRELNEIDILEKCYPDPDYRAMVKNLILNPGAGWHDLKLTTRDGAIVDSTWCTTGLSDGRILRIGIDVSERRRLEEQLRQSQKMEAIGTLAGGIAHDFNNILAAIVGNAELALDETHPEHPANLNLQQIMKAGLRARDLVREIVTFSRKSEKGKKLIHLTPILQETCNLLRASLPPTIDMNLKISARQDVVSGDTSQLQQVVLNLATNAAQAMPEGGSLDITLTDVLLSDNELPDPDLKPADYLMITCKDTGCGIEPSVKSRIFDPFFTTKGVGSGTGLGLAVAYGIVKSHDGAITVDSVPGIGTTFKVCIPKAHAEVQDGMQERRQIQTGTERILFVDDEAPLRDLTKGMLTSLGYTVTAVSDAEAALSLFRQDGHGFDVVITDQAMPGMSGLKLTEELLKIRPDLPVILCTGYNELIDDDRVRSVGAQACLTKPLLKHELSAAIQRTRRVA